VNTEGSDSSSTWTGKAETSVVGVTKENHDQMSAEVLKYQVKVEKLAGWLCIVTAASDRPLRVVGVSVLSVWYT
jgi:hypothetical protein